MFRPINFSAFLSNFTELKSLFPNAELYKHPAGTPYVFISMHIAEEGKEGYREQMKAMCNEVRSLGYELIADVSKRTLDYFQNSDIVAIAKEYGVSILRPDFGFTKEELVEIAKQSPICVNATNLKMDEIKAIVAVGGQVCAMHNYYPRTETGLDEEYFRSRNSELKALGIPVMAFIASDINKRGPIYDGLPTMEKHRYLPPYVAYLDMVFNYGVDTVFVGDGAISSKEWNMIEFVRTTGIWYIPVQTLSDRYDNILFDRPYTIRDDSPHWLKRLMESRQFATFGREVEPDLALPRKAGSITIDNSNYSRYSGEMQVVVENLPLDERVNVIARIPEKYLKILSFIKNETQIQFFKEI